MYIVHLNFTLSRLVKSQESYVSTFEIRKHYSIIRIIYFFQTTVCLITANQRNEKL
jgi:hypothetical protein